MSRRFFRIWLLNAALQCFLAGMAVSTAAMTIDAGRALSYNHWLQLGTWLPLAIGSVFCLWRYGGASLSAGERTAEN